MNLSIEIYCRGTDKTKRCQISDGDSIVFGRSNADYNLIDDPRLSRKHFSVQLSGSKIIIRHLSKTNPTLVASEGSNDFHVVEKVHEEPIGCRIIAGSHRLMLRVLDSHNDTDESFYNLGHQGRPVYSGTRTPDPSDSDSWKVSFSEADSVHKTPEIFKKEIPSSSAVTKQPEVTTSEVDQEQGKTHSEETAQPSNKKKPSKDDSDRDESDKAKAEREKRKKEMEQKMKRSTVQFTIDELEVNEKDGSVSSKEMFFPIDEDFFD